MSRDLEISIYKADNGVSITVDRYAAKLSSIRHNTKTYDEAADWIAAFVKTHSRAGRAKK